jgi:hypothetical protein
VRRARLALRRATFAVHPEEFREMQVLVATYRHVRLPLGVSVVCVARSG